MRGFHSSENFTLIFWFMTSCRLVGRWRHFGRKYYLQLPGRRRQCFSPKIS